ncbi:vacuolar amino acid transporter 2 [Nadsonia fulvescens var. elongata DSM 6958]|uniref:Vacuolar amino acid transporter 2 n=1 Tax=Nadsonia fulvescens var. elongata DSM 6958 TaxID=857566 RepID=A0A1E3PQM5_9ASCO|nr:vacuolar amino acid transporter 2 [Nadsonia fulvescens var. elongata DSM 6958]
MGENSILTSLQKEQNSKSSLKMAFMNMANSIIGAGIIGQAYAVKKSGLLGGIFLLVSLTFVVDWTIRLMVVNAKMSATDSYQATVTRCFGRAGLLAISIAQGAFAFGGSIAFCVIIGDTIPHVIGAVFPSVRSSEGFIGFLVRRNTIIMLFTLLISYPLSLNRDISKLAKASAVALLSMVVIVLVVVIRGPAISTDLKGGAFTIPLLTVNTGFFQGISIISFAFVCHHNSLLIYQSLRQPTLDRFATLTHWSTFVSMIACLALGLGGFLVFRDKTLGNLLNNFAGDDVYANLARFCFGFNMLTTLPLEIFVCREVLLNYFFRDSEYSKLRHFVTTTVLVVTAMAVALSTCNLGAILELVGAFSASTMAYILPPMCFLKLSTKKSGWRDRALPTACIVFGVVVMVLSSAQTIFSMINDTETSHCSV